MCHFLFFFKFITHHLSSLLAFVQSLFCSVTLSPSVFMHFLSAFTYNGGIRGEKLRSGHVSDAPGDPQVLFSDPVPLFVCRNQQIFDIIV